MTDFYTMFRVPTADEQGINLRMDLAARIAVYVQCACNLSAMMDRAGLQLTLLTNDRQMILQSTETTRNMRITEMAFDRDVPEGIPFRSAHFKLDVLKAFGTEAFGPRSALIDLDMLLTNAPTASQVGESGFVAFDITDEMEADIGRDRLLRDLNQLTARTQTYPQWFGGEFIMGDRRNFSDLSNEIEAIWPTYLNNIDRFAHCGDELVVTAALLNLVDRGKEIQDAGQRQLVHRWWSARTRHRQVPLSRLTETCFLHLPADKEFLASPIAPSGSTALSAYRDYVRPRLRKRRLLNGLLNLTRAERKHVGRL